MRELTLDEKISIKAKLSRKMECLPKLTMERAVFYWSRLYGTSIKFFYLVKDTNTIRKPSPIRSSYVEKLQYSI